MEAKRRQRRREIRCSAFWVGSCAQHAVPESRGPPRRVATTLDGNHIKENLVAGARLTQSHAPETVKRIESSRLHNGAKAIPKSHSTILRSNCHPLRYNAELSTHHLAQLEELYAKESTSRKILSNASSARGAIMTYVRLPVFLYDCNTVECDQAPGRVANSTDDPGYVINPHGFKPAFGIRSDIPIGVAAKTSLVFFVRDRVRARALPLLGALSRMLSLPAAWDSP